MSGNVTKQKKKIKTGSKTRIGHLIFTCRCEPDAFATNNNHLFLQPISEEVPNAISITSKPLPVSTDWRCGVVASLWQVFQYPKSRTYLLLDASGFRILAVSQKRALDLVFIHKNKPLRRRSVSTS